MFAGVLRWWTIAVARTFTVPIWCVILRSMLMSGEGTHYSAGVCAKIEKPSDSRCFVQDISIHTRFKGCSIRDVND